VLDLVPNHVAPDHPWVVDHPEYFVRGTSDDLARDPASYLEVNGTVFACGRDPYFPAWPEVLQLDASNPLLRAAMAEQVASIVTRCDALRCDMAMLVLDDVFERTWGRRADTDDGFWPEVFAAGRAANPDVRFWAEAYWDLEAVLVEQGFDACYDKRLYDRLVHRASVDELRAHLSAPLDWQRHTVRFVENHDEPRAASVFSSTRHLAALTAVCTLPGVALLHEGEADGRRVRVPVTLGRRPDEPVDTEVRAAVDRLVAAIGGGVRRGDWQLLTVDGWPDNQSARRLLAWSWVGGARRHVVVVNLSDERADGRVRLDWADLGGRRCVFDDLLAGVSYEREGDAVVGDGLYVALDPDAAHLFRVEILAT
jgi:glycosidase